MQVAGLLSSKQEANEIQFVAKICNLKERIHFLVKTHKIKELLKQEEQISKQQD
jgi:hypothetical protein